MKARARRVAATAVIAVGVGATGAVLAAPADAAQVVVGDCNATVSGAPGAPVALDLGAILGTGSGPLIPIGAIPQNGAKMLNASPLIKQNAGLVGGAMGALTKILGTGCDITAKAVNTAAAPVQQAAKPVTDAAKPLTKPLAKGVGDAQAAVINATNPANNPPAPKPSPEPGPAPTPTPGNGDNSNPTVPSAPVYGQPGMGTPGISPASLYSNIPLGAQGFSGVGFGVPGSNTAVPFGAQYAGAMPGSAPSFGQLGAAPAPGANNNDPVRTAGSAEALSTPQRDAGGVGLPLLLAVIALAGVAAALVRTWVLRRVSSS